jgi:hypothetical protein
LMTIIGSAIRNDLDVRAYLDDVLPGQRHFVAATFRKSFPSSDLSLLT